MTNREKGEPSILVLIGWLGSIAISSSSLMIINELDKVDELDDDVSMTSM